jgi:type I restriction enzyme R subunit
MNEATTRAEKINPQLEQSGWRSVDGAKILHEHLISPGKLQTGGRGKYEKADYVLEYKGIKLAVIEAKSDELDVSEGVMQAKKYAQKLSLDTTFSTNGNEIYQICMKTGKEEFISKFPTPDELWEMTFPKNADLNGSDKWREKFAEIPYENKSGTWNLRYYQEIAVQQTLETIGKAKDRILLTLATGTGKTAIAFHIAWKLYQTRWNLSVHRALNNSNASKEEIVNRRPRILFLADRNILADQAYNAFSAFPEDALVRISPKEIRKKGRVPTNGSVFFTIFQTFMSGRDEQGKPVPYFGEYPPDYFDFIIIDECHRGGANDESTWRDILEYFSPAVQLGLTATPKRDVNIDTYRYFGDPVFIYSLKDGINDGFLTPFKVKHIRTTMDDYRFTGDDTVIEGEIEEKLYVEKDFNVTIEIREREEKRVKVFLDEVNQKEKTIVFCANQEHAAIIRDLINKNKSSSDPFYCVRVTANDGEEGERQLREFQDNEKTIPTILTTSQKLSTGVDARNIRNIVLLRPIKSMVEFKQIIGRGTRLFDGKEFFTIYDFVNASEHFSDPEWDGEPIGVDLCINCGKQPCVCVQPPRICTICQQTPCICEKQPKECKRCGQSPCICKRKVKIKLRNGKEREIQHMVSTSFWSADGKPISAEEFLNNLFGELPRLFKDEEELRQIWGNPLTRKTLLQKLDEAGYPKSDLIILQQLVDMEKSDLFDVLEYIFNGNYVAMTRESRVKAAKATIFAFLNEQQQEFIEFVLNRYVETGVDELDQEKLPTLLKNKYQSLQDAQDILGNVQDITKLFMEFQAHLYKQFAA